MMLILTLKRLKMLKEIMHSHYSQDLKIVLVNVNTSAGGNRTAFIMNCSPARQRLTRIEKVGISVFSIQSTTASI